MDVPVYVGKNESKDDVYKHSKGSYTVSIQPAMIGTVLVYFGVCNNCGGVKGFHGYLGKKVKLYPNYMGEKLIAPICHSCWSKIGRESIE